MLSLTTVQNWRRTGRGSETLKFSTDIKKHGEKAAVAHVDGLHAAVLGSDFGLLDGQQVGSRHRDHRAAAVETHTHMHRHRCTVRFWALMGWWIRLGGGGPVLEDGPAGLHAADGGVLAVAVLGVWVGHLGPVNHQADGGGARARQRAGGDAHYFPIGSPVGGGRAEVRGGSLLCFLLCDDAAVTTLT